jgi:hypothetical protein
MMDRRHARETHGRKATMSANIRTNPETMRYLELCLIIKKSGRATGSCSGYSLTTLDGALDPAMLAGVISQRRAKQAVVLPLWLARLQETCQQYGC